MKHTLYTLEKKQFHLEGYWLFAGVLFFLLCSLHPDEHANHLS